MNMYLGLDIGSTTVKAVLTDETGRLSSAPIYLRALGKPLPALSEAVAQLAGAAQGAAEVKLAGVGLTGSGRETAGEALGLPADALVTEIYAHAAGAWHVLPGARTIVDIGGQDCKLIRLRATADGAFQLADFMMNNLCAAGTGAFLEMHAKELGFASIGEFATAAERSTRPSRIAGRCSVLAQSDVIHLRQKGENLDDIAAGLCRAVVRNVLSLAAGRPLESPVLFQGGVAANRGVVAALQAELAVRNASNDAVEQAALTVPPHHNVLGALGAALHARRSAAASLGTLANIAKRLRHAARRERRDQATLTFPPLSARVAQASPVSASNFVTSNASPQDEEYAPKTSDPVVLGLDVGSSSVKIAALDLAGQIRFTHYVLHEGRPLNALYAGFGQLRRELGAPQVCRVGVTGSGRDLAEVSVGADLNVDEITAQGAGARLLAPEANVVFEIGGQDAKFMTLNDEGVAEFEMNRICAAGTGAFVMEAAKLLGVTPGAEFDALALAARRPLGLNTRCCVFAKSDMVALLNGGAPAADVAAGVAYAVAKNYLTQVVGNRLPAQAAGDSVLFLGGLAAHCGAVVAACQKLLPRTAFVVPAQGTVSGALGAAHLALAAFQTADAAARVSRFFGFAATARNRPEKEFVCSACANACAVKQWRLDERRVYTGGVCDRFEQANPAVRSGRNFTEEYLCLLRDYERQSATTDDRPVIGVPRGLGYYEQGPLWLAYLRALGFRVLVSTGGADVVKAGNLVSINNAVCLPIKALLGHVAELKAKGVNRIFFPALVEGERPAGMIRADHCMLVQAAADGFLRPCFPALEFLTPVFHYDGQTPRWREELVALGVRLGRSPAEARNAVEQAAAVQAEFASKKRLLGGAFMREVQAGRPCLALLTRPYSLAPEADMGVSRHFTALGVTVAPMAILPLPDPKTLRRELFEPVYKSAQELLLTARFIQKQPPNLLPAMLNQFLCRQDTAMLPFVTKILKARPLLHVTLDENTGQLGIKTRCAAFAQVLARRIAACVPASASIASPSPSPALPSPAALPGPLHDYTPVRALRRFRGTVWMAKQPRMFYAGYSALGMNVRFLPNNGPETMDRGRKYFPDGEPCLPFIELAGMIEAMTEQPGFDPHDSLLQITGTRYCASTSLPALIRMAVFEKLGIQALRIVSTRDGFDAAEGVETFGVKFVQNLVRGLLGEEYLTKLFCALRPYVADAMRADALFEECLDDFYAGFGKGGGYYRRLDRQIRKLTAMPAVRRGSKPKILVTGEYFLRTQAEMNGQLYKKIEALGGEVLRTVLFADYAEMIPYNRPRVLWQLGRRAAAAREFFLGRFLIGDIEKIKAAFRPHIPAEIDPDPTATLPRFHHTFHNKLDASMLCEFYQTWWRMDRGGVDGIVIVHPFGCCKSAPVEPLIHKLYGDRVPVLTLSFDGQANVHGDNRLAAFMENIHARRRLPPTPRTDAERRLAAPPAAPSGIREYTHPAPQPALDRRA